jgi:hypothetical protein
MIKFAVCGDDMLSEQGMKCAIFEQRCITTRIESYPFEIGSFTIKSIEMEDQRRVGSGNGNKSPYGL